MIPKIIHYCWLSDEPIPVNLQKNIDKWQRIMPDYKFKKWDKTTFNIKSEKWVFDAYTHKKWAFAADFIRAYALFSEGGFYLDSDVMVMKRFDEFLQYSFVSSIEYDHAMKEETKKCIQTDGSRKLDISCVVGLGIQAAIIGAEKGNSFVGELLEYYRGQNFIIGDGKFNQLIAPVIYAKHLEKWGFRYQDNNQTLKNNIQIFNSSVFAGYQTVTFSSYAVHMCAGSWLSKQNKGLLAKVKKIIIIRQFMNFVGLLK